MFTQVREDLKSRWTMEQDREVRDSLWHQLHLLDQLKGNIEEIGSDRNANG